jgi:phosphopantetheine adenylyltransferase
MNILDLVKKIRKYQFGGVTTATVPGFIPYTPTQLIPRSQPFIPDSKYYQVQAPKAPEAPALDKDTLKGVLGKGHTNDVNYIVGRAEQAEAKLRQMMSIDPYYLQTNEGKQLMSQMTVSQTDLNKLMQMKENTQKAEDVMVKNNGGSAYATTSDGRFVVKNANGQLQTIAPDEYFSNREAYKMLTNAQVREERDRNPNTTLSDVSSYITNTLGNDKIDESMKAHTISLGSTGTKQVQEMIGDLRKFGSPEALIGQIKSGGAYSSNAKQVKMAMDSFLQGMPHTVKNTLFAEAATKSRNKEEAMDNVYKYIYNYFTKMTETKSESEQSLQVNEFMNKSAGLGADKTPKHKPVSDMVFTFEGGNYQTPQKIILNDGQIQLDLGGNTFAGNHLIKGEDKRSLHVKDANTLTGRLMNKYTSSPILTADGKQVPKEIIDRMVISKEAGNNAAFINHYPADERGNPLPLSVVRGMSQDQIRKTIESGRVTSVLLFDAVSGVKTSPLGGSDVLDNLGNSVQSFDGKKAGNLLSILETGLQNSNMGDVKDGKYQSPFTTTNSVFPNDKVIKGAFMLPIPRNFQFQNGQLKQVAGALTTEQVINIANEFDSKGANPLEINERFYHADDPLRTQQQGSNPVSLNVPPLQRN